MRFRSAGFTGTPFPKDEPMAANPPDGAIIDYALPAALKSPVTLVIRDANNREVRRFSSTDRHEPPNPTTLEYAPEWVKPKPAPAATPGMHRFVWNLHYPPPALDAAAQKFDGVWAPPGNYTVTLIAGGKTQTENLTVKPDPRLNLGAAAFDREFALATKVAGAWAQTAAALADATKTLKALRLRKDQKSVRLVAAIEDICEDYSDSENVPVRPPHRADSLKALVSDFEKLEHAVDGADADPSSDAQASYQLLTHTLSKTLDEWQAVKKNSTIK
jgi:hypothetical protein